MHSADHRGSAVTSNPADGMIKVVGKCTTRHLLAPMAVAGRFTPRRLAQTEADPAAATAAVDGKLVLGHGKTPSMKVPRLGQNPYISRMAGRARMLRVDEFVGPGQCNVWPVHVRQAR